MFTPIRLAEPLAELEMMKTTNNPKKLTILNTLNNYTTSITP